ncbi:hypothetical protein BX616_000354 [Lobosporangium transversale]|uniref:Uncharacterized protein n=1 Tax=Lobosporangium transversale TaxID=64571 RepID=A0A1Y2GI14_9FUNG|nr:hypothetical protein BCR41DRAFT_357755 [Lobosporangium transversale]XP_021879226.1 hypothetical protein BCR41DRAFT_357757 [Lobosporangium transversale]KAF9907699.1 hypothetical protein BX616_000354 [Lobosporangium transversale]ORZ10317.1 hypothetical protein BCR41DRAFT_357755 [Lobosporangium transversale]ORZ10319.1 hypothetical protein BCR41DRAFT_357757 [Lobosporangium transversale]|eukprot:XP_021879224.1 hypothetical protein BCR41DRAFT_357755 [Lobosporangium transversale]
MRFSLLTLGLIAFAAVVKADCSHSSAPPDDGEIALYRGRDCTLNYLNVGAMNSCQNWPDFGACSAITRRGVTCDIYKSDGCSSDYIATIDSAGYRNFCGTFPDTVQSVRCRAA